MVPSANLFSYLKSISTTLNLPFFLATAYIEIMESISPDS